MNILENRVLYIIISALIICMAQVSCTPGKPLAPSNELVIYVPAAPPAIPLYKLKESRKNILIIEYTDISSQVIPHILKDEEALYIIPTNMAAKLYNRGRDIAMIALLSSGLVQLVSSDPGIQSLKDLNHRSVYIPAPGSSPDVIGRYLFKLSSIVPNISYGSAPEIAKLMVAGKIRTALLPEPLASAAVINGKDRNIRKIADLRQEWLRFHPDTRGIPQVGICGSSDYIDRRSDELKAFIQDLRVSVEWTNTHCAEAASLGKENLSLNIPENIIAESVGAMNLTCYSAKESRKDLEIYFKALYTMDPEAVGSEEMDPQFYAF